MRGEWQKFGIEGRVALAMGLALLVFDAPTVLSCAAGPALVQHLLEADRAFDQDENLQLWERAADCEWSAISDGPADLAISQFHDVAHDNGLAAGLRTFARNGDFRLYAENISPMALGEANAYLNHQPLLGTWREIARGRSADSALLFSAGEVSLNKGGKYQYAELWQFDPKVANWGVRLLLLRGR